MSTDAVPAAPLEGIADLAFVERVLDEIEDHWRGYPDATAQDRTLFTLAVSEVLTNIVEHGSADHTVRVSVDLDLTPAACRASIRDTARPARIDWSSVSLPDEFAESGRGLALTLTVLDRFEHTVSADGNTWVLERSMGGQHRE
jgi:serine/threonine-protein kinase RsbW